MISPKASLAAGLAGAGLAVALSIASPAPGRRIYLPSVRLARPTPAPHIVRPRTYEELRAAVATPGSYVVPAPGEYQLSRIMRIARGTTLDGEDLVVIRGKTIELFEADGAVVRRLSVRDAAGDGIRVTHTHSALIERVSVAGSKDGEIDVVEGPDEGGSVTIRDSILSGRKCMLLGDPDEDSDSLMSVTLENVSFLGCHVRTPKVHKIRKVTIRGGLVRHWSGPRLDVQMGGFVEALGTRWEAGPESELGTHIETGGRVTERGAIIIPWKGGR